MVCSVVRRAARWAAGHWWLLAFVVFVPPLAFAVVDRWYLATLDVEARWQMRIGLGSGLLLFANLVVLWWYAVITRRSYELASRQFSAGNRPCVVLDWQRIPPPAGVKQEGYGYVAYNIGPGLAVNVVCVRNWKSSEPEVLHIGALPAGGRVEVPEDLRNRLVREDPFNRERHILLAEPLSGDVWIMSANLIDLGQRISHQVAEMKLPPALSSAIHRPTLGEYIDQHWTDIQKDIEEMVKQLDGAQQRRPTSGPGL
ncbi:MAG: hypothetical protein AB1714_29450 [Acidobacteriota bacterium]